MKMRHLSLPLLLIATALLVPLSLAQVPAFAFDKAKSSIGFNVKASVAIAGKFDKWDATGRLRLPLSRQAFWTSRLMRTVSIPAAA